MVRRIKIRLVNIEFDEKSGKYSMKNDYWTFELPWPRKPNILSVRSVDGDLVVLLNVTSENNEGRLFLVSVSFCRAERIELLPAVSTNTVIRKEHTDLYSLLLEK